MLWQSVDGDAETREGSTLWLECECLAKCPFFNDQMANMPALAGQIKQRFCLGAWDSCARYVVFKALGPGRAPADLYPLPQIERARGTALAAGACTPRPAVD